MAPPLDRMSSPYVHSLVLIMYSRIPILSIWLIKPPWKFHFLPIQRYITIRVEHDEIYIGPVRSTQQQIQVSKLKYQVYFTIVGILLRIKYCACRSSPKKKQQLNGSTFETRIWRRHSSTPRPATSLVSFWHSRSFTFMQLGLIQRSDQHFRLFQTVRRQFRDEFQFALGLRLERAGREDFRHEAAFQCFVGWELLAQK